MFRVSGRRLIDEIESMLDDLDVEDWELSTELESYILENGDNLLDEWLEINKGDESNREKLNLFFDTIDSAVFEKRESLERQMKDLDAIGDELERLIEWEDEDC